MHFFDIFVHHKIFFSVNLQHRNFVLFRFFSIFSALQSLPRTFSAESFPQTFAHLHPFVPQVPGRPSPSRDQGSRSPANLGEHMARAEKHPASGRREERRRRAQRGREKKGKGKVGEIVGPPGEEFPIVRLRQVQEGVRHAPRPRGARSPVALREKTLRVRPLREDVRALGEPRAAQGDPHEREGVRVQAVQQELQALLDALHAHAHPLGHAPVSVRVLWQAVSPEVRHEEAHVHPHGREAAQVRRVWQGVQPVFQPHHAQQEAHGTQALRLHRLLEGLLQESGFEATLCHARRIPVVQ